MENQEISKQDCGCSDGCCTPQKKSSPWKIWLFIIIVVAVGAIITAKMVSRKDAPPEKCCDKTENPACCSQSNTEE